MQAWTTLSAALASWGVSVRNAFTRSDSRPPPGALHGTRVTSDAVPKGTSRAASSAGVTRALSWPKNRRTLPACCAFTCVGAVLADAGCDAAAVGIEWHSTASHWPPFVACRPAFDGDAVTLATASSNDCLPSAAATGGAVHSQRGSPSQPPPKCSLRATSSPRGLCRPAWRAARPPPAGACHPLWLLCAQPLCYPAWGARHE